MTFLSNKIFYQILIAIITCLLTSCVLKPNEQLVYLTKNLALELTVPPMNKVGVVENHLVEIITKDDSQRFIAQVEYHSNEIAMVAVSPEGLPLFDFVWHSKEVTKINQYVPLPFSDVNFIIADIQLCNWPLDVIRKSIIGSNVKVSQQENLTDNNILWQRRLSQNNKTIISIKKISNGYELKNTLRGYNLILTNQKEEY